MEILFIQLPDDVYMYISKKITLRLDLWSRLTKKKKKKKKMTSETIKKIFSTLGKKVIQVKDDMRVSK